MFERKKRNEEKLLIIGRARVPTWEISSLRLTNWAWLRLQVLANRYSNKVPRGWVARCGDEFFIHPRRTLIKTRRAACTPPRRRRGNSLRIKITLEKGKERECALVIFRRGWFIHSSGFAVPFISPAPLAAFFLLVPTVNKANCPNRAVELAKF